MLYGSGSNYKECYNPVPAYDNYTNTTTEWRPNVGITFGSFDLFHAGHSIMLEQCRQQCEFLIVGLQTDPTIDRPKKNKPVQTVFERYAQLEANRWVDKIIPYETELDLCNILSILNIRKRFLGEEYKGGYVYGQEICEERKIELVFVERRHGYSSSELRERIANVT